MSIVFDEIISELGSFFCEKKEKNQIICLSKLSMLDYYLKLSYKEQIISKKKYESISKHLLEIKLMLRSWIESNEKSE